MGEGEVEALTEEKNKNVRRRKKKLYNSILQQMEFYFSDSNLSKDRFLSKLLAESPCIDINVFLKFNKMRKLNCTIEDIQKALKKSEIVEVTEENKICRKKPVRVKDNVDACTVYVENIPADATHDWLSDLFSEFGKVAYVSIPKYKHNKVNKGFAFVEFETENEANEALTFFESINLKMSLDKNPEQLRSIATFEGDSSKGNSDTTEENRVDMQADKGKLDSEDENDIKNPEKYKLDGVTEEFTEKNAAEEKKQGRTKRKHSSSEGEDPNVKKLKPDGSENVPNEEENEGKKKKKKFKKEKKKIIIKELGIQILSKKEWKKLRNKYLDLQKKKMKEFKNYLHKQKFSQRVTDKIRNEETINIQKEQQKSKQEFLPGVIVKVRTDEPCTDVKKLKAELKSTAADIHYVDIVFPGSQEIFVRFSTSEAASEFCTKELKLENKNINEKCVISGQEEEIYWKRMEESRTAKFEKQNKKQRGRDKLLKKAKKEQPASAGSHVRFDEPNE